MDVELKERGSVESASSLPEWKQLLLERKRKEEEEKERREREEEERLASIPAWKRGIIQRRRARQEGVKEKERELEGVPRFLSSKSGKESLRDDSAILVNSHSQVSVETCGPLHQNPFMRSHGTGKKEREGESWGEMGKGHGEKSSGITDVKEQRMNVHECNVVKFAQRITGETKEDKNTNTELGDSVKTEHRSTDSWGRTVDLKASLSCGWSVSEVSASGVVLVRPSKTLPSKDEVGSEPRGRSRERSREAGALPEHDRGVFTEGAGRVSQLLSKFGERHKAQARSKSSDSCAHQNTKRRGTRARLSLGSREEMQRLGMVEETQQQQSRNVPKRSVSFSDGQGCERNRGFEGKTKPEGTVGDEEGSHITGEKRDDLKKEKQKISLSSSLATTGHEYPNEKGGLVISLAKSMDQKERDKDKKGATNKIKEQGKWGTKLNHPGTTLLDEQDQLVHHTEHGLTQALVYEERLGDAFHSKMAKHTEEVRRNSTAFTVSDNKGTAEVSSHPHLKPDKRRRGRRRHTIEVDFDMFLDMQKEWYRDKEATLYGSGDIYSKEGFGRTQLTRESWKTGRPLTRVESLQLKIKEREWQQEKEEKMSGDVEMVPNLIGITQNQRPRVIKKELRIENPERTTWKSCSPDQTWETDVLQQGGAWRNSSSSNINFTLHSTQTASEDQTQWTHNAEADQKHQHTGYNNEHATQHGEEEMIIDDPPYQPPSPCSPPPSSRSPSPPLHSCGVHLKPVSSRTYGGTDTNQHQHLLTQRSPSFVRRHVQNTEQQVDTQGPYPKLAVRFPINSPAMQRRKANTFTINPRKSGTIPHQDASSISTLHTDTDSQEESGTVRYPAVENIEVIGGYHSLEKSCLAGPRRTPKAVKVSFHEAQLEQVCEYPSESSVLASFPNPAALNTDSEEEEEDKGRVFRFGSAARITGGKENVLRVGQ